jgi:RNase P subunit RPR2
MDMIWVGVVGSVPDAERRFDKGVKRMICPICGMPMVHYRTRGYACHIEEHNQERHMQVARAIMSPNFDDSVTWCIGNQESGYHAHPLNQQKGWLSTLCGAIITTEKQIERVYRRPTCQKCLEILSEENSRLGE